MKINNNKRAKALITPPFRVGCKGHSISSALKDRAIEDRAIEESNNYRAFAKKGQFRAIIRALAQLPRPSGRGVRELQPNYSAL
ncbi:MAG: hypothetical protein U9Q98_08810 [Bacteroidota bacterium]|nr:hypothetical protein [Bacteroidota bacterium]